MARDIEFAQTPALAPLIERLYAGPWQLIQLRGAPLGADDIDRGDVDFLASADSVSRLLDSAFDWGRQGHCHLIVDARTDSKVTLQLISIDGRSRLRLDLWIELRQIADGRASLRYEDCGGIVEEPSTSIRRLPLRAEIALYIEHLHTKQKDLASAGVQERLAAYEVACIARNETGWASIVAQTAATRKLTPDVLAAARGTLRDYGLPRGRDTSSSRWRAKLASEARAAWLAAPRKRRCIAVTGCDGSGKTSLVRALTKADPDIAGVYVGKRLYRSSLLYKIASTLLRPLLFQPREKFDDTVAPFAYLRASVALEILLWWWRRRRGITLIDRSLIDFLLIDRKTDNPRPHSSSWLASFFGRRIPTIHLLVPAERLAERKLEMTQRGHDKYDRLVFSCFTRRVPTSYAAFHNGGELAPSTMAASRLIAFLKSA